MRKLFNHLTHGGQTFLHNVRMTKQVLSKVGKWLLCLWVLLTGLFGWLFNGTSIIINTFYVGATHLLTYLGLGFTKFMVSYPNEGEERFASARAIAHDPYYANLIHQSLWK